MADRGNSCLAACLALRQAGGHCESGGCCFAEGTSPTLSSIGWSFRIELTPGNTSELEAAQDLTERTSGLLLGDQNFWFPRLKELLAQQGVDLQAPFRRRKHDPWPQRRSILSCWRYRIDTIFSQLVERTGLKRIWARDVWHLWNRRLHKILMHTMAAWTTTSLGKDSIQFARLVA